MRLCLPITLLALTLTGCGGGDDSAQVRNAPSYSEEQVVEALDLTTKDNGISYQTRSGCEIAVVLISKNAVDTYAGAGDTVVTTEDGEAGVKVISPSSKCLRDLERRLALLG